MENFNNIPEFKRPLENRETDWLTVKDLRVIFNVGDTKARKMMAVLPSVRIGKTQCILISDLNNYIKEHGGINIHWD